ncbi:MAG: hypothetical protein A2W27_02200 [Deltaproteobacteria bacterium RBG_16_44_11]|nr:MAG: hypothetical protein A2W27_02200 [Deltaproteobacteria bacterium RBG_16_44_11]
MLDAGQISKGIDPGVLNGLFALGGVILGSIGAILRDIILRKLPVQIERVRIHDKDRIEAYKELIVFIRDIQNSSFPLAEDKEADFKEIMKDRYEDKILRNMPYYHKDIIEELEKMESNYLCLTNRDLISEVDCSHFIEEELYQTANKISKEIKAAIKSWK